VGIKDKISDVVDDLTGDSDSADIPRRQPDGDPPVPPVEVPGPDLTADGGLADAGSADSIVTTANLRELLAAGNDAALVVEGGRARVVAGAAGDAAPILSHADLTTMVDGAGDRSDETLDRLAAGLNSAVRQQGA